MNCRTAGARARGAIALLAAGCALAAASATNAAGAAPQPPLERPAGVGVVQFGVSHDGRPVRVARRCAVDATVDVLVIGVIHGTETAGVPVVGQLARAVPPPRTCLWLLASLNPDGRVRGTRQNARGVDLNRNFPGDWRGGGSPFGTYYPGRAAASERETRAAMAMVRRIGPEVTVWYHQHATMTIRPPGAWRQRLAATYARVSGLPMRGYPSPPLFGTASAWQHRELPRSLALVVELPAGPLPARAVSAHAAAVRALAIAADRDPVAPA